MVELNPEHPVTAGLHDQWHKMVGILIHKYKLKDVVITAEDIKNLESAFEGAPAVVMHARKNGIHLFLCTEDEGARIMKKEKRSS
jgi:hypothetical protein